MDRIDDLEQGKPLKEAYVPIELTEENVRHILDFREKYASLFNAITKDDRREAERIQNLLRDRIEVEMDGIKAARGNWKRFNYNVFILAQSVEQGDTYMDITRKMNYIQGTYTDDGSKRACCCGKHPVEWMGFVQLLRGQLLVGSECITRDKLTNKKVINREKRQQRKATEPPKCKSCRVVIETTKYNHRCLGCNMKKKTGTCTVCGTNIDPKFTKCYGCFQTESDSASESEESVCGSCRGTKLVRPPPGGRAFLPCPDC